MAMTMRIFSVRFWRKKGDAALIQWDATAATLKALGCHNIDRVLLG